MWGCTVYLKLIATAISTCLIYRELLELQQVRLSVPLLRVTIYLAKDEVLLPQMAATHGEACG